MDVAARSFLQHGYAGTTMSGVAATLGGSKGTLWKHFPTKEELFKAVVERATLSYQAQLTEILAHPEGDLRNMFLRVASSFLTKLMSQDAIALYRLVVAEAERFPEVGRIFYERAPQRTRAILATFLDAAMARGELRRDDPELAARALMMLTMGGLHQKRLIGLIDATSPAEIESDAAFGVDVFLRAYAV